MPFRLLYGGGLDDQKLVTLCTLGVIVDNRTNELPMLKSHYKPIFNKKMAAFYGRMWPWHGYVYRRRDGRENFRGTHLPGQPRSHEDDDRRDVVAVVALLRAPRERRLGDEEARRGDRRLAAAPRAT